MASEQADQSGECQQFKVDFNPTHGALVEETAEALGLDGSELIQMIVSLHLAEYEAQARAARGQDQPPE